MPSHSSPAFNDRNAWPDHSLRQLLRRIDDELERRNSTEGRQEDLETLEQRLLNEARRYQQSGGVIRG